MARSLQWGAVVGLLSLIILQSQAQDATGESCDDVFDTYTENGEAFTEEEFFNYIVEELDDKFPDPTSDLLDELMMSADTDDNSVVDCAEYNTFMDAFVTNNS